MMINLQPFSILPSGLFFDRPMATAIQHRNVIEYAVLISHKTIKTTSAITFFASHAAAFDLVRTTDPSNTSTSRLFMHEHFSHHSKSASPGIGKRCILAPSRSADFAHLAV
jgi:hypothetical protein